MCKAAHGEPPEDKPVARHLCGKGHLGCVNPKHLEWSTNSVNQMDRVVHGTSNRGQGNGHAKLSDEDVISIYTTKIEEKFLAEKFNVSITTIYDIKRKRTWKWLTDSIDTTNRL